MSKNKPHTILVVEDQKDLQSYLKEFLLDNDYLVLAASDGIQALASVEKSKPDLIILDLGLPNTGHHFLTSLQSRCQSTSRQANSIKAVRRRTLPCLVIGKSRWLAPLELIPPHRPV